MKHLILILMMCSIAAGAAAQQQHPKVKEYEDAFAFYKPIKEAEVGEEIVPIKYSDRRKTELVLDCDDGSLTIIVSFMLSSNTNPPKFTSCAIKKRGRQYSLMDYCYQEKNLHYKP